MTISIRAMLLLCLLCIGCAQEPPQKQLYSYSHVELQGTHTQLDKTEYIVEQIGYSTQSSFAYSEAFYLILNPINFGPRIVHYCQSKQDKFIWGHTKVGEKVFLK